MAVPSKIILYQLNDQFIEIDGLADSLSLAFQNSATVTATLKDRSGAPVTGLTNVTLNYVASSSGIYRGAVPATFNPTKGGGYTLVIDANNNAGAKAHLEIAAEVQIRKT